MTDQLEQVLRILAGLGMFFFGIKMLGKSLRTLASGPFRKRARQLSATVWLAALWGGIAGFATQSGRTTALILASLVQGRILEVRMAAPLVIWANFGCTLIVFAAVFPIKYLVLFLLGLTGVGVAFEKPKRFLTTVSAGFGLALMLYGLSVISGAAGAFTHYEWFTDSMRLMNQSFLLAFFIGLVLTIVAQSHMAIILITLAMTDSGLFDFEHAVMIIYGTHLGSSAITYLTGAHFKGRAMQVVWVQVLYNFVAVAIFLSLFVIEQIFDTQILQRLALSLSDQVDVQAAIVAITMNLVGPVLLTLTLNPFVRACENMSPPLVTENLSQPEYLQEDLAHSSPVAGLMLCEKEQLRLLKRLPDYLASLRHGEAKPRVDPTAYHQAYAEVLRHIQSFQSSLITHALSPEDTEWLVNLQNRQELLNTIEAACYSLWEELHGLPESDTAFLLGQQIIEALDTMILTSISALEERDITECDLLNTMTAERGESMEQIRKRYLASAEAVSPEQRNYVMHVTSVFERATWSLGRFGKLMRVAPLDWKEAALS